MSYAYRCTRTRCRKRVTLPKKIERYVKPVRCKKCGWKLSFDPEVKRRSKRDTCYCDGYPFPHRRTSEPWCVHAKQGPDEEHLAQRFGYDPNKIEDVNYNPEWDKEQDWQGHVFDPIDPDIPFPIPGKASKADDPVPF